VHVRPRARLATLLLAWSLVATSAARAAGRLAAPAPGAVLEAGATLQIDWSIPGAEAPGIEEIELLLSLDGGRTFPIRVTRNLDPRTRGLAWIMCGYAEELEFLALVKEDALAPLGGRAAVEAAMLKAAQATSDFYIENTSTDGIPYWDTGAPGLSRMRDYLNRPADPFNDHEPVDSSAATVAAQGLLRLGRYLEGKGRAEEGRRYWQAGLTVANTLFGEPYLSTDPNHQGLILHSIYHRPNGWDYVPKGSKIPRGESSMWGDYHARELALYLQRITRNEPYYAFFGPQKSGASSAR